MIGSNYVLQDDPKSKQTRKVEPQIVLAKLNEQNFLTESDLQKHKVEETDSGYSSRSSCGGTNSPEESPCPSGETNSRTAKPKAIDYKEVREELKKIGTEETKVENKPEITESEDVIVKLTESKDVIADRDELVAREPEVTEDHLSSKESSSTLSTSAPLLNKCDGSHLGPKIEISDVREESPRRDIESLEVSSKDANFKISNESLSGSESFQRTPTESQTLLHHPEQSSRSPDQSEAENQDQEETAEDTEGKVKQPKGCTLKTSLYMTLRLLRVLGCLFFFICSLDLLSSSFQLLGGKAAGAAFRNSELLKNPICGLMIGVVATAILQSSSTSTSIVTTMVAGDLLSVPMAIPIVMGANIGTSVTGVIVSVAQARDAEVFKRAFSAATVHDTFNWLTVFILLPIEVAGGVLYRLTNFIVAKANIAGGQGSKQEFLKVLTKPITKMLIQLDKKVLGAVATGKTTASNMTLLKDCSGHKYVTLSPNVSDVTVSVNVTDSQLTYTAQATNLIVNGSAVLNMTQDLNATVLPTIIVPGKSKCWYVFSGTALSDQAVGGLVLVIALALLLLCLTFMVRDLKALLAGHMAKVIQKRINADFPGKCRYFTGYAFILLGAILTILVQSSSVVVSTLTPLVGVEFVSVERVFPMMLGANLGTTSTAILAAFASTGKKVQPSLQIALCHMFFNLLGIMIWYPVFFMRKIPLGVAKYLGETTARYRWFAFMYLIFAFFLIPLSIFGLSFLGWQVLAGVGIPIVALLLFILVINIIQHKRKSLLPRVLQTWDFLPEFMRSLRPLDNLLKRMCLTCKCDRLCICLKCCKHKNYDEVNQNNTGISKNDTVLTFMTDDNQSLRISPNNSINPSRKLRHNDSIV